jgi:NADH-quinone oxidoreductase subunit K
MGVLGIFLNRKNVIIILMSIELMLLAVNINFVAFSAFWAIWWPGLHHVRPDRGGGEAAIGLAILVVYFRNRGTIAVEDVNLMKG